MVMRWGGGRGVVVEGGGCVGGVEGGGGGCGGREAAEIVWRGGVGEEVERGGHWRVDV